MSETLQFAGLFASCQCLTQTSISATQVVALGTGSMCITFVLALLGQALSVYSIKKRYVNDPSKVNGNRIHDATQY